MSYYYLVASLPTIGLDEKLPITTEELLAVCEKSLEKEDMADFKFIMEGTPEKAENSFVKEWMSRETQLRNALARIRAGKNNVETQPEQKEHEGFDTYVEKTASEAMNQPNPLDRQMFLDRFRWDMIDEMTLENPYGQPAVFGFALKFRIALKWAQRDVEKGRDTVKTFIKEALQETNNE